MSIRALMNMKTVIVECVDELKDDCIHDLQGELSDEATNSARCLNEAMARLAVTHELRKLSDGLYDEAKKHIEEVISVVCDPGTGDIEQGEEKVICQDNVLAFYKKRNNDSKTIDTKILLVQLAFLGVERDIIERAKEAATVTKKGATYYTVTHS